MKLFTIPFAGGSACYYKSWKQMVDENIDLIPIELTGRGNRVVELLYENMNEMILDIFEKIKNEIVYSPYALFGHSMGALICFELACLIKKNKLQMPKHIFFSGMDAPRTENMDVKEIHLLDGDEFQYEILAMGGTSKEIFECPELSDYFIPIIKNDLRIVHNYKKEQKESVSLDCGFTIFTGKGEKYSKEQLAAWNKYTTVSCKFYEFDGGHFFINKETEKIISIINETLN